MARKLGRSRDSIPGGEGCDVVRVLVIPAWVWTELVRHARAWGTTVERVAVLALVAAARGGAPIPPEALGGPSTDRRAAPSRATSMRRRGRGG